jgi:ABC-type multidrug transport system fused ATPase/permease subunit
VSDPARKDARFKPRSLLGILRFLRKYPGKVTVCVALLLANIAIEMTLPQIIGNAITELRRSVDLNIGFSPWLSAGLFVALVLVRFGNGLLVGPIRNRVIQATLADIRAAIYDAIQRLAFSYHDRASSGELISRSTTDIFRLQDFFFACLFLSVDIVVTLAVTLVLIFVISPALGALTLGTVTATIALIGFYASKLRPQWRQVHDLHGAMTTVIQENIAGVRVVKAFAREQAEVEKFRGRKDVFLNSLLKTVNYWAARVPFAQFIFGLSLPLVLWLGGRMVIAGTMPIGDLAKVVFYIMALGHRVGAVGQFTNIVQTASASAERILEVIHEPQRLKCGKRDLPAGRGTVTFEHVSFSYAALRDAALKPAGQTLAGHGSVEPPNPSAQGSADSTAPRPAGPTASLDDVSFQVQPGQAVAIVGPTGSGKTTLVNLISRFYDPSSGRVLVEGVDVRELKLEQLRRAVGVIFQETFLFSTTAAENIAYGKPGATREDIERCARAAQAHEFVMELEDGYDTIIGERGVSLSGGQRQRIAIARAFLMDPRILILDDATASVDSKTERLIQEAMRRLCEGRTSFVIAQRFSTVQHADQILVLKQGRIVERGRHDELIQRGGFYREIFEQQIKR